MSKLHCTVDPRWDSAGFNAWAEACELAWIRVGYLRELHWCAKIIPYRNFAPQEALWIGAPPPEVQIYHAAPYTWLGKKADTRTACYRAPGVDEEMHPDPKGFHLRKLVEALDGDEALDSDLVAMFHVSAWYWGETESKRSARELYEEGSIRLLSYNRCKAVPLCEIPDDFHEAGVLSRCWGVHEFHISAYCQRLLNTKIKVVRDNVTPEKLMTVGAQLELAPMQLEEERAIIQRARCEFFSMMPLAMKDEVGFRTVCETAQLRWVFMWYIQELALRQGPAPRCQDLPYGAFKEGAVPEGSQAYVVSYCWASSAHFSPGGVKICEVAAAMASAGASSLDVVFVDFLSLPQDGGWLPSCYTDFNPAAKRHVVEEKDGMVRMRGRSGRQQRQFRFALFETTRLYVFQGCRVLVLPKIEEVSCFPQSGPVTWGENRICEPPRHELQSNWGFSKSIAYESSGWPCAEFTAARLAGTIANAQEEAVQRVEAFRRWPDSPQAYAEMLHSTAQPVLFTKKGDIEAVRFNFYKYSCRIDASA